MRWLEFSSSFSSTLLCLCLVLLLVLENGRGSDYEEEDEAEADYDRDNLLKNFSAVAQVAVLNSSSEHPFTWAAIAAISFT